MAKIIDEVQRPALILAHNKTLAAQLYHEFKQFFPRNAVEYFVSYYDYYQPEAYIPAGDIFIEKEATVNEELDKLRLSATRSLFERRDCIIVSSVSCIYGLGSPEAYYGMLLLLERGQKIKREEITKKFVEILYDRNDINFRRGTFRVRGDIIEVYPTYDENAYRIELFGDEIDSLSQINPLFGDRSPKVFATSHLSEVALCSSTGTQACRHGFHCRGIGGLGEGVGATRPLSRVAKNSPAETVRPGDD